MPSGSNPNSRANLIKGEATRFKTGDNNTKKAARKGAAASAKKKREQKEFRELFRLALSQTVAKDKDGNDLTAKDGIVARVVKMAMDGNMRAVDEIIDMIGERPKETESTEYDRLDNILDKIQGNI